MLVFTSSDFLVLIMSGIGALFLYVFKDVNKFYKHAFNGCFCIFLLFILGLIVATETLEILLYGSMLLLEQISERIDSLLSNPLTWAVFFIIVAIYVATIVIVDAINNNKRR